MSREIDFQGRTYQIGRLTPWDAFHVMRRLSPALIGVGPQILGLALDGASEEERAAQLLTTVFGEGGMRFAQVMSIMPNADLDYVATMCLSAVRIKEGPAWAQVIAQGSSTPTPMYPHITLPVILRLVIEVLKVELTDFLTAGRSSGVGQTTPTT